MTRLGEYLAKRNVNRAGVSRQTGINTTRLHALTNSDNAQLRADELYVIAKAIGIDPCELLEHLCGHLKVAE